MTVATETPERQSHFVMDGFEVTDKSIGRAPNRSSWAGNSNPKKGGPEKTYPHIQDLVARASPQIDINSPIRKVLKLAEISAKQAGYYLQLSRYDLAFVEYLLAANLVLNFIPQHKDAPSLHADRGELWRINHNLRKLIKKEHERFEGVKQCIKENNAESGVRPTIASIEPLDPSQHKTVIEAPIHIGEVNVSTSPTQHTKAFAPSGQSFGTLPPSPEGSPLAKPIVRPKSEALNRRYASSRDHERDDISLRSSTDALSERFARLRAPSSRLSGADVQSGSCDYQLLSSHGSTIVKGTHPVHSSTEAGFQSALQESTGISKSLAASGKPMGPRTMPIPNAPIPPPKVPLNTQVITSMPRAPSPTYSPARSSSIPPGNMDTSRITAKGLSSQPRFETSSTPYRVQHDNNPYQKSAADYVGDRQHRQASIGSATEIAIGVEKLYDYLRLFNLLLIDVRSREDYDQGHIFAHSIICIEPAGLHTGMSGEELEERLILSPDVEQTLFRQRHLYDLVVYYDQSSTSTHYLKSPREQAKPSALRALFDALDEFSFEKTLQNRPVLLVGGLDAWADFVGKQALKTSDTASSDGKFVTKPAQRSSEVHVLSSANSANTKRKNPREFIPLDPEEQKVWMERARAEGGSAIADTNHAPVGRDELFQGSNRDEMISPLYENYEDFFRRFPTAPPLKQSMVASSSSIYPSAVQDSPVLTPLPPSRPPPAVPRRTYSGVSDRVAPQVTTFSRSHEGTKPPLYTDNAIPGLRNVRLPQTGLINFGVTCYMNATIQCLSATLPLTGFFLSGKYKSVVQQNWKGSYGVMPELYANVIRDLWNGDVEAIRPVSFRKFCTRLKKQWGDNHNQQDAKEFLDFLLDCLHEDLNVNWKGTPLRQLTSAEELKREQMPMQLVAEKEFCRYTHRDLSVISRYFAGQHASRLRCTTCKITSTTYEPFYSISVEIPRSGAGDLRQCLKSFCKEEMLSGDEVWKCPYCKCEREATKQITITRAPQFLIVHFKRFSASKTESARKIHTPIDFPLYGLDIEPFMASPMTSAIAQQPAPAQGPSAPRPDHASTPPYCYDAYAVMRHLGPTVGSGHYVSLIKAGGSGFWRQFNDQLVTDIDPKKLPPGEKLQNGQAYLVFYARSNGP